MKRLAFAFAVIASTANAGGMDEPHVATDPCPDAPLVQPTGMTDTMFVQWKAVREMTCGPVAVAPRAFFDRASGDRLTDDEIARRIFNGSKPVPEQKPRVDVVPSPAAGLLLLTGLAAFGAMKRRARA